MFREFYLLLTQVKWDVTTGVLVHAAVAAKEAARVVAAVAAKVSVGVIVKVDAILVAKADAEIHVMDLVLADVQRVLMLNRQN